MLLFVLGAIGLLLLLFLYCSCFISSKCAREEENMNMETKKNSLEMYKELSNEDKTNLTIYCIYDSIYVCTKNNQLEISDDIVMNIQKIVHDLYLDDEYYNFSESQIAYFITQCYVNDNNFLQKIEDMSYSDILQAIDEDNCEFYKDNEMER